MITRTGHGRLGLVRRIPCSYIVTILAVSLSAGFIHDDSQRNLRSYMRAEEIK